MSNELILSQFPQTKNEIQSFVDGLVESVMNGDTSPLLINVQLSALEAVVEGVKKNPDFKESVLNEAMRYGTKTFDAYNAQIQVKETGVKNDYSLCGHPQYDAICEKIAELTEQKKSFEKYLQSLRAKTDFINPETGEMCAIYPPVRTATTSVTVTIKK